MSVLCSPAGLTALTVPTATPMPLLQRRLFSVLANRGGLVPSVRSTSTSVVQLLASPTLDTPPLAYSVATTSTATLAVAN
jgi:hypothetical protein